MPYSFDVAPLAGYREDVGLLLASLVDSTREWRGELGEPPVKAITWQPHPNSYSIGSILLHIAAVELYWFSTIAAKIPADPAELEFLKTAETDVDGGLWPIAPEKPISWYYEIHDNIRIRVFELLKSVDPDSRFEHHSNEVTFRWILAHVVQHDSYHGGQAVVLNEFWKKGG